VSDTACCPPGSCPRNPIVLRFDDGHSGPITFHTVADLDAIAEQPQPEVPEPAGPPAVVGIRVLVPAVDLDPTARTYATGRLWDVQDGTLYVEDEHGRGIAEFPPGHWRGVEDILAEAAG
jgi:hypothetical protein